MAMPDSPPAAASANEGWPGVAPEAQRSTCSLASIEDSRILDRTDRSRTGQRWFLSQIASKIVGGDEALPGSCSASRSPRSRLGRVELDLSLMQQEQLDQLENRGSPRRAFKVTATRSSRSLGPKKDATGSVATESQGGKDGRMNSAQTSAAVWAALAAAEKEVVSPEIMKEKFNNVDQMIEEITRGLKLDGVNKNANPDEDRVHRQKEIEARRLSLKMELAERAEGRSPHRNVAQKLETRREQKTNTPGVPITHFSVAGPAGSKQVPIVDVGMLRNRVKQPANTSVKALLELQRLRDARERNDRKRGKSLAAAAKAALQPASPTTAAAASGPEP